jgi:electron transport complex protein RnfC
MKAASQKLEKQKTVACIRCGVCLHVCPYNLSPVFIKEAFAKEDKKKLAQLRVELCEGCGNCSYFCPSRIDLKGVVLRAKSSMCQQGK